MSCSAATRSPSRRRRTRSCAPPWRRRTRPRRRCRAAPPRSKSSAADRGALLLQVHVAAVEVDAGPGQVGLDQPGGESKLERASPVAAQHQQQPDWPCTTPRVSSLSRRGTTRGRHRSSATPGSPVSESTYARLASIRASRSRRPRRRAPRRALEEPPGLGVPPAVERRDAASVQLLGRQARAHSRGHHGGGRPPPRPSRS